MREKLYKKICRYFNGIGNDFTSIADLQQLLSVHAYKLTNISVVSRYVISRLIS